MEKRWRSVDQAAEYLSVLVYTVRDATCKGELPYVRAGKRFIYDVRDLDAWAEARKQRELDHVRARVGVPRPGSCTTT